MGLMSRPFSETQKATEERTIKVLETLKVPVQEAAKKFYKDQPKDFLYWLTTSLLLILIILVSSFKFLPLGLYLVVCVYLIFSSPIIKTLKKTIKHKKK